MSPRGRFSSSYTFRATTRTTTYRFRVAVRRDSSYSFLPARSKEAKVTVMP